MQKYLSIKQVSENLGVAPKTVRAWVKAQKIAAIKLPGVKGEWKISELAIDRWIKTRTVNAN